MHGVKSTYIHSKLHTQYLSAHKALYGVREHDDEGKEEPGRVGHRVMSTVVV